MQISILQLNTQTTIISTEDSGVRWKMKNKNIYTARIAVDDELLSNLGPDRIGCMESWNLMSQDASLQDVYKRLSRCDQSFLSA